ncbi:MAG: carboxypeptidase M32 [Desulfopila sp.]
MPTAYDTLQQYFHAIAQLDHAITFLQWDQLVMMPPGGNSARATAIAEFAAMRHEKLAANELGDLLENATQSIENDEMARSLKEIQTVRQNATCIPAALVKAQSLAGSTCEHAWRQNRRDNDWQSFLQNFREVVTLAREEARARYDAATEDLATPYDALLQLYCRGDGSALIDAVFTRLKDTLPQLIEKITARQHSPAVTLPGLFSLEDQRRLSHALMEHLGFNFDEGRLDVSSHPFSTGVHGDQRITTRFRQQDFLEALLATAHETGHAGYEGGLPKKWDTLPIGAARNMCIHESQSLLFEKQIFLARPFFSFFATIIHEILPQTKNFSAERLREICCRVQPSYIRVEADEVTYPLHVILRFEIEKELINGSIAPDHIPELWDEKMLHYLGLSTAGNYRDGCMQDIHWTDGSFGYFPSYTMGALNAAQLFTAIRNEHGDWQDQLARGEIHFIRHWLQKHIWSVASSMDAQQILEHATGQGTNPDFFLNHIEERYLGTSMSFLDGH